MCCKILGSELLWCISGALVQDGLEHIRGVTWRAAPANFRGRKSEMKILGSCVLWCILGTLFHDGLQIMRGVTWRAAPAKSNRGMCEMKILGSKVLWCISGTLVQDGLAQMRGVTWGVVISLFYANVERFGICDANKALIRCGSGNMGWKKKLWLNIPREVPVL